MGVEGGQPERQLVGHDGSADAHLLLIVAIVPDRSLGRAAEVEARRLGGDVDHPGRGVAAEERALGPTQNLDAVDVDKVLERHAGPAQVDVVDIDADGGVEAIGGRRDADAADPDRGIARVGLIGGEARRLGLHVGQGVGAGLGQVRPGKNGKRNRHLLRLLLGAPGGDDHFSNRGGKGAGGGRGRRCDRGVGGVGHSLAEGGGGEGGDREAREEQGLKLEAASHERPVSLGRAPTVMAKGGLNTH